MIDEAADDVSEDGVVGGSAAGNGVVAPSPEDVDGSAVRVSDGGGTAVSAPEDCEDPAVGAFCNGEDCEAAGVDAAFCGRCAKLVVSIAFML